MSIVYRVSHTNETHEIHNTIFDNTDAVKAWMDDHVEETENITVHMVFRTDPMKDVLHPKRGREFFEYKQNTTIYWLRQTDKTATR